MHAPRLVAITTLTTVLTIAGCAKVVVVEVPPGVKAPAAGDTAGGKGGASAAGSHLASEGVFYALPRTVVVVTVKADKVVTTSARYARFAPIFAPAAKPPCGTITKCADLKGGPGKTTKYSLQHGATFSTSGEPDPARVYMVKFTNGGALDQTLSLAWNEAGLLSTASASVTNRTTDIVVSGVKLATSLFVKTAAGSFAPEKVRTAGCEALGQPKAANDEWVLPILLGVDSDPGANILVANYCDLPPAAGSANDNSRNDYVRGRDENDLVAATAAFALRALPMIEQRTALLTSTSLNLFEPVKQVEKLDTLIDEQVKALFVGSKSTTTWELPFEVRTLSIETPAEVVAISEKQGVCPKAPLAVAVKPMPDEFQGTDPKCEKTVTLSLKYHPDVEKQLFARVAGATTESGDRSFRYVIPAQVRADLVVGKEKVEENYGSGVFSVAQLGHVASLPAARRSKTLSYDLAMIEATGGLKSFKLGSTGGLDAATVDALAGAGGTYLDARAAQLKEAKAEREKAEAASDELAVLTRQQTILKLKDEICELQKKYGLECTVQP